MGPRAVFIFLIAGALPPAAAGGSAAVLDAAAGEERRLLGAELPVEDPFEPVRLVAPALCLGTAAAFDFRRLPRVGAVATGLW